MARRTKASKVTPTRLVATPLPSHHAPPETIVQVKVDAVKTKKVVRAVHLMKHAHETFGSSQKADHWLNRPNQLLGNKTPLEVMLTDPDKVEAALVRIDHGVYV